MALVSMWGLMTVITAVLCGTTMVAAGQQSCKNVCGGAGTYCSLQSVGSICQISCKGSCDCGKWSGICQCRGNACGGGNGGTEERIEIGSAVLVVAVILIAFGLYKLYQKRKAREQAALVTHPYVVVAQPRPGKN